jgi:hypothetical protein
VFAGALLGGLLVTDVDLVLPLGIAAALIAASALAAAGPGSRPTPSSDPPGHDARHERRSEQPRAGHAPDRSGNVALMRVPPAGGLSKSSRPPSAVTRSAIPTRP